MPDPNLDDILEKIRGAAVDPAAWGGLQSATEAYLGAFASQLGRADHANRNAFYSRTTRFPEIDAHIAELAPHSEPVRFAAANPNWVRFSDYDYIDETGIDRSDFYRACEQFDVRYRLALRLVNSDRVSKALLWLWPAEAGPVGRETLKRLEAIEAPIRLAAEVSERLGDAMAPERRLIDGLEAARAPALLAEPTGAVLYANRYAHAILSTNDGLALGHGSRIVAAHRASANLLERALCSAAAALTDATAGGGHFPVLRPSGKAPFSITVAPLAIKHQLFGPARPILLILLSDPSQTRAPDRIVLRHGLGLTEAEAEVALLFGQGRRFSEIADMRGVCLGTVRSQVKSIFAKAGVRRQSELMRLLASFTAGYSDTPFGR